MSLKNLLEQRKVFEDEMAVIQEKLDSIQTDIEDMISSQLLEARKAEGKDTGTINIVVDGVKVKENIHKRVKWDNSLLGNLFKAIADNGENPEVYIDVDYKIPEARYEKFPEEIRKAFEPARTVEVGKPSVKFEF